MEKETLLSTLTEKLGETPLSQRTLSDYIDNNLPAEGTEPDDAYWQRHTAILKSVTGNYRADLAAGIEDFKRTYKPQSSTTDPANKGGDPDLLKRIEQLERQNAANAKNAATTLLRSEATAKGKSLKVANEAIWADAVEAVQIGDNDTAEDVTDKAKKIYEQKLRRYMGEGAAPYGSSNRPGASKEAEEAAKGKRDALKTKMQARGRLPKPE